MVIDYALAGYRVASRDVRQDWQDDSLPDTELVSMSSCVADLLDAGPDCWDDWFDDAESARRERAREVRADLHVLGVGFAVPDLPELLTDITASGWERAAGSLPERLTRREPAPGGRVLGFELVGYDSGIWHTWTCLGGLVRDVGRATGVRPGNWGLIQDEQQARLAADWLTESGLGDPKVFFWAAAMVVEVPA